MKKFEQFSNLFVRAYLEEKKIEALNDIQLRVIPEILKGKSVNVIAKTGSGKTLTYLLPVFDLLKSYELHFGPRKEKDDQGKPLAIILAPTRELCTQLLNVSKSISHHAKLRCRALLGGTGTKTKELKHQQFEILIATPGRLSSSLKKGEIDLSELRYLILDEADQLLELGFKKDMEFAYSKLDPTLSKVFLFSATMSESLNQFMQSVFKEIDFYSFNTEDKNKLVRTVKTFNIYLKDDEKNKMSLAFLKNEAKGKGIIFVNKHETVDVVLEFLKKEMPKTKFFSLHGEMSAISRKKNYAQFISEGGVLVCTDIMARGIDISDLQWVLNYDLPFEAVYYIHRCGRVGRNAKNGFVYNLVCPKDASIVSRINIAIKGQSALILNSLDEKKFKAKKSQDAKKEIVTKLDRKKKELDKLKNIAGLKGSKPKLKEKSKEFKHTKKVINKNTPRYKRNKPKR